MGRYASGSTFDAPGTPAVTVGYRLQSNQAIGMPRPVSRVAGGECSLRSESVLIIAMARCPHCETDITEWAERLERANAASTPKVWTCPSCDAVLGVSDWGRR